MKICSAIFITGMLILTPLLSAQEATFFVASSVSAGQVREIVYIQNDILSELVWPLDSLATVTLGGSIPLGYGFSLGASLEVGKLLTDQIITDSDWLNLPQSQELTHYSQHTATLNHYFEFRGSIERLFTTPFTGPITYRHITVVPRLEFRFTSLAWTAKDGYIQYPPQFNAPYDPWTSARPQNFLSGTVLTYSQTRLMLAGSLSIKVPISNQFLISTSFSASPLIQCIGKDEHILTNTLYEDFMIGGYFLEPEIRIDFRPQQNRIVFLSCTWTILHDLRGDTWSGSIGATTSPFNPNGAGSEMNKLAFSLGYSLVR